jgi:cell division protein FtsQ
MMAAVKGSKQPKKTRSATRRPSRFRRRAARLWAFVVPAGAVIFGVGALSLFFVWSYHYVLESPHMMLTDINVEGVDDAFREELLIGAGLSGNVSLLALNLNELKRIFEAHPWVRQARVERRFPHSLHISLEKEIPVAVVVMDRLFYMNRRGEIFKAVDVGESPDFPVVTGVSMLAAESREQLRQAAYVVTCVERQTPPWSTEALSEVHMGVSGHVSLYYKHLNAEIRVASGDFEGKMSGLRQVVSHLRQSGRLGRVAAINLNQENGAVVSMISG